MLRILISRTALAATLQQLTDQLAGTPVDLRTDAGHLRADLPQPIGHVQIV
jgi:hypothetical protein